MGVSMTTLSVEMNQSECNDLISKTKIKSGVIVYGHIPMMRMKYCLLMKCNEGWRIVRRNFFNHCRYIKSIFLEQIFMMRQLIR